MIMILLTPEAPNNMKAQLWLVDIRALIRRRVNDGHLIASHYDYDNKLVSI